MEACFSTMFEDVGHERSFNLLISLTDPGILRQSKITDYEIDFLKYLALEILHRQKCSKDFFALQLFALSVI